MCFEFASVVLCHNPPSPGLPDHTLPVLNHDRTGHNTKPMEHWCIATVAWYCLVSISWIVFINTKSGRIRALLWYLIITYQSHKNKNDHLTRPREGQGLNAWVSRYPTPRSSNKQLLLWKISCAGNKGLPFCWLM